MKKTGYYIFPIFILAFACNKNSSQPEYYGSASMTVNGINWQADKVRCTINTTCYNGKLGIELYKFNAAGELRETYGLEKFTTILSEQKMFPLTINSCSNDTLETTYSTSQDDGDVLKAFYNADISSNNYLRIEKYNSSTKEISGSFTATYVILRYGLADTTSVDTIRVTNGKFNTKILN